MKKIALLGVENSHANTFLSYIKEKPEFSDIEVVGVYTDDKDAQNKLLEKFDVPVLESYDAAVGKVDGVIITARHGDNHYKYAKPYISSGIPMFIDKPITVSEDEAINFMKELRAARCRISGGSSIRNDKLLLELKEEARTDKDGKTAFGMVKAPVSMHNAYGDFFFYSQHLVEAMCEIFGAYPDAVSVTKNGDNLTVVFEYPEYNTVGLFHEGGYLYYAERYTEKSAHVGQLASDGMNDWFYGEFKEYVEILKGESNGRDYTEFIAPVFVMNAIARSIDSGKREVVRRYTLD